MAMKMAFNSSPTSSLPKTKPKTRKPTTNTAIMTSRAFSGPYLYTSGSSRLTSTTATQKQAAQVASASFIDERSMTTQAAKPMTAMTSEQASAKTYLLSAMTVRVSGMVMA